MLGLAVERHRGPLSMIRKTLNSDLLSNSQSVQHDKPPTRLKRMRLSEWRKSHPPADYLVEGVLQKGKGGIICGVEKVFKSACLQDLAVSCVSATPFLGKFPVLRPVKVLYLINEGEDLIDSRLRSIATARGIEIENYDHLIEVCELTEDDEPFNLEDDNHMGAVLNAVEEFQPELVIVDSGYKAVSGEGMENRSKTNRWLDKMTAVSRKTGVAFLVAWHANKSTETGKFLTRRDISYSGLAAWMRQWIFLNHRSDRIENGIVDLWLEIGSSRGDSHRYALRIDEGKKWSTWETTLTPEAEARQKKTEAAKVKKVEATAANAAAIKSVLQSGETTRRKLRSAHGPNGPEMDEKTVVRALEYLGSEVIVENRKGTNYVRLNS